MPPEIFRQKKKKGVETGLRPATAPRLRHIVLIPLKIWQWRIVDLSLKGIYNKLQ
jgi:hypothetical protein